MRLVELAQTESTGRHTTRLTRWVVADGTHGGGRCGGWEGWELGSRGAVCLRWECVAVSCWSKPYDHHSVYCLLHLHKDSCITDGKQELKLSPVPEFFRFVLNKWWGFLAGIASDVIYGSAMGPDQGSKEFQLSTALYFVHPSENIIRKSPSFFFFEIILNLFTQKIIFCICCYLVSKFVVFFFVTNFINSRRYNDFNRMYVRR